MNIDYSLSEFIKSKLPQSLILKGSWGIGKTYYWNQFIRKNYSIISKPSYAYISLFGINNLDDLKFQLFQNSINTELVKNEFQKFTLGNKIKSLVDKEDIGSKAFSIGKYFSNYKELFGQYSIAIEKIAFQNFSNTLICFDDLERKGSNIEIKEIFGLASFLKEQKNCSIIFIVNDDQVDEFSEDYQKYKEKTIDREIAINRSTKECCVIIFDSHPYQEIIFKSVKILGINNLRILDRIKLFIDHFLKLLPTGLEAETIEELIKSIILFIWVKFGSSDYAPSINILQRYTKMPFGSMILDKEGIDENDEKKWRPKIQEYGFSVFTEYDEIIWNYIDKGLIAKEEFESKVIERDRVFHKQNKYKLINEAWDLFHNSFKDNEDEFVAKLTNAILENIKVGSVSISNINSAYSALKDLNRVKEATLILEQYKPLLSKFTRSEIVNSLRYSGGELEEEIHVLIDETAKEDKNSHTFQSILDEVAYENGWGGHVTEFLKNKSVDDYFNFFKELESEKLSAYINFCLRFETFRNPSPEGLEIVNKMKEALKLIFNTSTLNSIRVSKIYKINPKKNP